MNQWFKKIKMKAILPVAAVVAAATIGTTFAWKTWDLSVTNHLMSHTTDVKVNEEFNENEPLECKKVWFTNTGSSSVFLRVSYTEYWQKEEGERIVLSNYVNGEEIAKKRYIYPQKKIRNMLIGKRIALLLTPSGKMGEMAGIITQEF